MDSDSSNDKSGADAPAAVAKPASGGTLQSDGIPWVVQIDGKDLVVRNILATCWGGKFDSGDSGQTESSVPNNGYPTAGAYPMGVSLPDNGPDISKFPSHALDLNPNVALHFAPTVDPKKVANQWSENGFSYRIIGGAKYIS